MKKQENGGELPPIDIFFLIYFGFRKKNQKDFWLYKIYCTFVVIYKKHKNNENKEK